MTQTFNEPVEIIGASDDIQLEVKGYSTQTQPLEAWQDNSGTTMAQVTGEGSLEIGNNLGGGAPHDALIQANYNPTLPTGGPTSAWHTLGQVTTSLTSLVTWVIHELQLLGTSGVSGLQTALRVKLTNSNTGTSTSAELRALDAETINQGGSSGSAVGQATSVHAAVSNATGAYLNKAVGVEVALSNDASGQVTDAYGIQVSDIAFALGNNYALYTGAGKVRFGDEVTASLYKLLTSVATTLASDAFTVSKGFHVLSAETPTTDNLATINGGGTNILDLTIQAASGNTITVKNGTGNIFLNGGADFTLTGDKTLRLFYNGNHWADIGAGGSATVSNPSRCEGRATLTSGTPITTSNVTGATQAYFTPYRGERISLYDGSIWPELTFTEQSIKFTNAQTGTTTSGNAVVTGLSDTSQFINGMEVTGTGIPTGATISSIDSGTQIHLSANATGSGSPSLTFKVPNNTDLDIYGINSGGSLALRMIAWNARSSGAITGATNATPIVITSNGHGLSNDDIVTIINVGGNTNANTTARVAGVTTNTFQLTTLSGTNIAGNAAYTSGGTWRKVNQNVSRATAVTTQNGMLVKSGDATWRYLFSIHISTTSGQTNDSVTDRGLWNYYNPVEKEITFNPSGTTWNSSTASWHAANNDLGNHLKVMCGNVGEHNLHVSALGTAAVASSASAQGSVGIGINSFTTNSAKVTSMAGAVNVASEATIDTALALYDVLPILGFQMINLITYERTASIAWRNGALAVEQTGLHGHVWC